MKKLITLSVLVLVFGLSSASFAQDKINALGVQLPIESREVSNHVQGDYSFLHKSSASNIFGVQLPLKQVETDQSYSSYGDYALQENNQNYIVIFGVKIPYSVS